MNTFIQFFAINMMMILAHTEQHYPYYQPNAIDGTHEAQQHDDLLTNSYVNDFVNNPEVVNHPAFPILARRGLDFYNSFARQQGIARQGEIGAFSSLASVLGLGLGAAGALGTAIQAGQITDLSNKVDNKAWTSDVTAAVARVTSLESSTSAICTNVATLSADLTKTLLTDVNGNGANDATTVGASSAEILARLNLIEDKINAVGALTC